MDKRQYYPPTPAVSHSSYCCFPNRGILSTKCGRITIANRLIALRNTISLSADFLIVSADALIVATATMRKAKNVYALSSPSILFFFVVIHLTICLLIGYFFRCDNVITKNEFFLIEE